MHNHFAQAEGVANLDQVPEAGALLSIGFAKPLGGTGGFARLRRDRARRLAPWRLARRGAGRPAADPALSPEARREWRHAPDAVQVNAASGPR